VVHGTPIAILIGRRSPAWHGLVQSRQRFSSTEFMTMLTRGQPGSQGIKNQIFECWRRKWGIPLDQSERLEPLEPWSTIVADSQIVAKQADRDNWHCSGKWRMPVTRPETLIHMRMIANGMARSCVILISGDFQAVRQLRIPTRSNMRFLYCVLMALATLWSTAHAQTRIDAISTQFRWLGPNDKIVVERYDDPKIRNISCYLSRAETGGVKGGLGFAEDPSRFSVACRAVGRIEVPAGLPKSEVIGFASASLFFKTFQIHRAVDPEKNVLVYTVVSTKLINGSPFNSISVVPAGVP
jgi:CreA protein